MIPLPAAKKIGTIGNGEDVVRASAAKKMPAEKCAVKVNVPKENVARKNRARLFL